MTWALEGQVGGLAAIKAATGACVYANTTEVQATMEKHHQLKIDIQRLTEEWEKLTLEAERMQLELAEVEGKG